MERSGGAPAPEEEVLLGVGANLGDPVGQLARAVERLREGVEVDAVSSVYRSEPVGYREQPDFYNLVVRGRTRLSPRELLALAQRVEEELGRRPGFRNAPRPLDVDLLAYGRLVLDAPGLTLPHPRLHERAFVLLPLEEAAPGWRHPVLGATARELRVRGGALERIERWGALPPPGGGGG